MEQNVNEFERYASAMLGGYLAVKGLTHGSILSLAFAGLGYMMVKRGITGHCNVYESLGINTNQGMEQGQDQAQEQRQGEGREQRQEQPAMAQQ